MSDEVDLQDDGYGTDIGTQYLFWDRRYPEGKVFGFSSTLSGVGVIADCAIRNKTVVMVVSDTTMVDCPAGKLAVTQVLSHNCMWVPTVLLIPIDKT